LFITANICWLLWVSCPLIEFILNYIAHI
jgi:hypothetical protein